MTTASIQAQIDELQARKVQTAGHARRAHIQDQIDVLKRQLPPQPTQKEAAATLKRIGWQLKKLDGEFEIYPTGQRGARSYFASDLVDAIATARHQAAEHFNRALAIVSVKSLDADTIAALQDWHSVHHADWRNRLESAWYSGNYGFALQPNTSAYLQRLRNYGAGEAENGHEFIAHLDLILKQLS